MFKKIAGIGLSLCMLLSTSAFAVTTSTTTKYGGEEGKITVSTSVKDAEAGSKLTYLTFKNSSNTLSSLKGDEIVYVDQYTLASSEISHTFSYTTSDANISSKVLVGGSDITTPVNDSVLGYVIIKDDNDNEITNGSIISGDSEKIESDILYKVELDAACNIKSIKKINDNSDVEDALCFIGSAREMWISGSLLKGDGATEIIVEKEENSSVATLGINTSTYAESAESCAAISVYGQVIGSPDSFGVIISRSSINTSSICPTVWSANTELDNKDAIAFPALGRNAEGGYVVQIADDSLKGSTVYACAYSCSDSTYTFGDVKNVSVSQ